MQESSHSKIEGKMQGRVLSDLHNLREHTSPPRAAGRLCNVLGVTTIGQYLKILTYGHDVANLVANAREGR